MPNWEERELGTRGLVLLEPALDGDCELAATEAFPEDHGDDKEGDGGSKGSEGEPSDFDCGVECGVGLEDDGDEEVVKERRDGDDSAICTGQYRNGKSEE